MTVNEQKQKIIGAVAISLAAILWGFDGIVLTPRLYNLNVTFVVFILHLIPFVIMNIFFYKEYLHIPKLSRNDALVFFLIALFGGAIGTVAVVKALFLLEFKHLTIVILLQKLQPIFAIGLAIILLKEKIKKYYLLWASIAIIASYFLTFGFAFPDFNTGSKTIYAALLSLLAAFSFGSSTVFSKKILGNYSFKTATFFRYGITTMIMFFYVLVAGEFMQFGEATTTNWLFFIIIGLTSGSGAIFLYYYGLKKVRAIIATICELFFPISAILFDYIFNNQILSTIQWVSAAIMIYAIINLNRKNSLSFRKKS